MKRYRAALLWFLLLAAGFGLAGRLAGSRHSHGAADGAAAEDYPPGVRFVTVALGGFRGVLADALWLRAARKQDDGDFFEAAQLADWVTRLTPTYPEIWSYHAWNIAYNIGAMFPDPEDRWAWVMRGVRLLRDEGIPANPRSSKLYWDLGWMYSDKVSGRWEENPLYFRVHLASDMTAVLAGLDAAAGREPDAGHAQRLAAAGLRLDTMRKVDALFGPLDWRLPETHAIYWAFRGQPFQEPTARWCDRLIWTSLVELTGSGTLYFEPGRKLYVQGPRLDLAEAGMRRYRTARLRESPLTAVVAERFLEEAMLMFHAFGMEDSAGRARDELAEQKGRRKGAQSTQGAVLDSLAERMEGVTAERSRQIVLGFLKRAAVWRGLGNEPYAAGFMRLAELHRDVLSRVLPPADAKAIDGDWSAIVNEAESAAAAMLAGEGR